jgi:putative transposase
MQDTEYTYDLAARPTLLMRQRRMPRTMNPPQVFHYCLMPNHIHLLVKTHKASDFSLFMKKLNLAYFHHYNKSYSWAGHFWQDRFKSQPVGKDEYFIQCGKYIELNPVRASIVIKAEDYSYSSYHYYAQGGKNDLITQDIFYNDLGDNDLSRQQEYVKLVLDEVVENSYLKPVWGSNYQRYHEDRKVRYHQSKVFSK